jgi:HD-like signal output (HDOD) protein
MAVTSFLWNMLGKAGKASRTAQIDTSAKNASIKDPSLLTGRQSEIAFYGFLFANSPGEPLTVPQRLAIDVVRENLSKKEYRIHAVPRLPSIIPKLLRSLRDPNSSARDYVAIVNKDPAMSAAVLKLANSVYFNPFGSYIGDIERAVVKLGSDGLRSVLSAAVMQPIIQRDSPYFSQTGQRLWTHSLTTAVACELVGEARKMERFKVYLLGLVHDVGKITLFSELCKQHKLNGDNNPSQNAFIPAMRRLSPQLSCLIAKDWQLPEEIVVALQEQLNIVPGNEVSPYGELLYQANLASEAFAFTPVNKRTSLSSICDDFKLPKNLFTKLEELSIQL